MLKRNSETRYRSFRYVSSTSNLAANNRPLKLNFKTDTPGPCRLSLNKENEVQPEQSRARVQTPKLKQRKHQSEWSQNSIYNTNNANSRPPHLFLQKRHQQTYDTFQSDLPISQCNQCSPYQQYFGRLEIQLDLCSSVLNKQKSELGQLRQEIIKIKVNVDKSLRETQQLMQQEISRLRKLLGGSLKEHNKVVVNSKQKILLTRQIYAQTFSDINKISLHLSKIDNNINA